MHIFYETNEPIRIETFDRIEVLHSNTYLFYSALSHNYYDNTIYPKVILKTKNPLELESIYETRVIDWTQITSKVHPTNDGLHFCRLSIFIVRSTHGKNSKIW